MPNDVKQESKQKKKSLPWKIYRDEHMKMEQACNGFYPVAASCDDDLEDKL
jgi:hypothetical protein